MDGKQDEMVKDYLRAVIEEMCDDLYMVLVSMMAPTRGALMDDK
jgi:hypothetical protein